MGIKSDEHTINRKRIKKDLFFDHHLSTAKSNYCAFNQKISENTYKIEILLGSILTRKNMAFHLLVKKIDYYFLLEFLCAILQELNLWDRKMCNNGINCNLAKTIRLSNNIPKKKRRKYKK
ncbi:MAG: hypothetical protein GF383_02720 [Candidatus Lokiarchaeota archaeon]|nr:hypothetical protein [Candidatus Lokiarchaeota archaeon]